MSAQRFIQWRPASAAISVAMVIAVALCLGSTLPSSETVAQAATPLRAKVRVVSAADTRQFVVSARSVRHASCGLLVRAPGTSQSLPFLRADAQGRVGWAWSAGNDAPRGKWTFTVRCSKDGKVARRRLSRRVRQGARRGQIGEPSSFQVVHGTIQAPIPRGRDPKGRGAGTNPFDFHQCTWLAWEKRADVYDTAVSKGVPAGGSRGTSQGQTVYVWDGSQWFGNAQKAGIPTGAEPVAGALVSFDGYPGNPYGHVAYVEQVESSNRILISECDGFTLACRQRWIDPHQAKGRLLGYVYGGPAGDPNAKPPETPPVRPTEVTLTVSNKVTNGPSEMREDKPAYLSTRPANFCKRDGCAIANTDRSTGGTYAPAVCQRQGPRTTNGDDTNANDDSNPGLYSSTLWYGIRQSDGSLGYISEVWIDPSQRGGLNLASC